MTKARGDNQEEFPLGDLELEGEEYKRWLEIRSQPDFMENHALLYPIPVIPAREVPSVNPDDFELAIELRKFCKLSAKEIASILKISIYTIRNWLVLAERRPHEQPADPHRCPTCGALIVTKQCVSCYTNEQLKEKKGKNNENANGRQIRKVSKKG